MGRRRVAIVALSLLASACTGAQTGPASKDAPAPAPSAPTPATATEPRVAAALPPPTASPAPSLAAWLRAQVPSSGRVTDDGKVLHTWQRGDDPLAVAKAYLDVTSVYTADELAKLIKRGHEGDAVEIPAVLTEPPRTGAESRLGWPADGTIKGIFLRRDGGKEWPVTLERLAVRGMNAVVLDGKDYEGYITYPTRVALANDIEAAKHVYVRSLARAVQFAHAKGIRVIMRNSCFHDPWLAKQRPALSVQSKWGKPYPLQWVDPSNADVQAYIVDVIKEQLEAGVDEIQLDYIRYPVQGIQGADFHLEERGLPQGIVVRDFVKRVKSVLQPHDVPLSLDVFGVVAWNRAVDVVPLGQDLTVIGAEADVLSPMVYPSHFAKGFNGFDQPGDHPEVAGIGTKATVEVVRKAGLKTIVRSWLQAFPQHSPSFGPEYIAREIRSVEAAGGQGWLLWHPGGEYSNAWRAIPPRK